MPSFQAANVRAVERVPDVHSSTQHVACLRNRSCSTCLSKPIRQLCLEAYVLVMTCDFRAQTYMNAREARTTARAKQPAPTRRYSCVYVCLLQDS
jgi:hypothetical protein